MVFHPETNLQRKRRRRLGGGGRNSTTCDSIIKDCFCPCNHVIGCTFTALVCLWVWFLHRAISHDPPHPSFNNNGALDSLFPGTRYIPPVLPEPMFPPDMKNPHQANDGAFLSSSSSKPRPLMLTWQSNQHAFNQDRAIYYPTFANRQQNHASDDTFLVALFDGHGRDGHLMAEFVTRHFADALAAKLNAQPPGQSDEWIAAQLNATFFEMEALAVALAPAQDFAYTGGCTASVTMRLGNKLYFANAGDSRTMLASNFESTHDEADPFAANVWYSTRLDKANLPDERARIQALGGKIHDPPPEKEFQPSRVVVTSQYLHDTVALAMSRSLGDVEWTAVGVTPEPIVDVIRLDDDDDKHRRPYLIVASDGMWDCRARRPQFFAKQLGNILFESSAESDAVTQTTKLVDFLKEITPQKPEWYRDDITVIAFAL